MAIRRVPLSAKYAKRCFALRWFNRHLDPLDLSEGMPCSTPVGKFVHAGLIALGDYFDGTIDMVANPSGDAELFGFAGTMDPVANPLNPPGHNDMEPGRHAKKLDERGRRWLIRLGPAFGHDEASTLFGRHVRSASHTEHQRVGNTCEMSGETSV